VHASSMMHSLQNDRADGISNHADYILGCSCCFFPILSDFVSQRPKIAGTRLFAALIRMTLGGVILNPSIVTLSNAKSLRTSSVKDLFSSFILVLQLFVNSFCNPKSAVCCRHAGVD
jgi:hypothetical protein